MCLYGRYTRRPGLSRIYTNCAKESSSDMKRLTSFLLILTLLLGGAFAHAQDIVIDMTLNSDQVRRLQIDLIGAGYMTDDQKADGIIGDATREAIISAQQDLGMDPNGLYSDELAQALCDNAFPLKNGKRSSLVYDVQQQLYRWGYLETEPTGYYGSSTVDAVTDFQSSSIDQFVAERQAEVDNSYAQLDVPADVVVDLPLISKDNTPCDGVLTQEWYDFLLRYEAPAITAQYGDESNDVKRLQKRLHSLGYMYTSMNGKFGDVTTLALKYFQYRNNLPETGVCERATYDVLFSVNAVKSDEYVMPYMAYVKRNESRVYIYGWDGRGYNTKAKAFKCSCGKKSTPTLAGTFYAIGPISEWYYMPTSNTWVMYAFQIQGNYFFHSVLFDYKGDKTPTGSVYQLGKNVSHGCIRLAVEDIKWMFENCTAGMKVVIE